MPWGHIVFFFLNKYSKDKIALKSCLSLRSVKRNSLGDIKVLLGYLEPVFCFSSYDTHVILKTNQKFHAESWVIW